MPALHDLLNLKCRCSCESSCERPIAFMVRRNNLWQSLCQGCYESRIPPDNEQVFDLANGLEALINPVISQSVEATAKGFSVLPDWGRQYPNGGKGVFGIRIFTRYFADAGLIDILSEEFPIELLLEAMPGIKRVSKAFWQYTPEVNHA